MMFSLKWFAFKMLFRWAAAWVIWWFARYAILWLAEKTGADILWKWYGKLINRSRSVQGPADGPWEKARITEE